MSYIEMNEVDACSPEQIAMIEVILANKFPPIYKDVWRIGLNLSLRIGDLLSLKFSDIDQENRSIKMVEQKSKKKKLIRLNTKAMDGILKRKKERPNDIWLFQVDSNRAKNKPVSRVSVGRVFKEAGDILGLTVSTHSMRKSRGMAMHKAGVAIEKIAKVLNHSHPASTMRYIGITKEEILQTYDDFQL